MSRVLILGIGNLLWADEGFGVRAVEEFQRRYAVPPEVIVMDGGTQGLGLLPYVQEAEHLVILDAVDFGLEPGTLVEKRDAEVPAVLGSKAMSLHQVSFQDVLALCQLTGREPQHLYLIGVQPVILEDYGGSLSPLVKSGLLPAVERVAAYLQEHGIACEPRPEPAAELTGCEGLELDAYERLRPPPEVACRVGDERFLALRTAGN
ncbi:HyaD/HybD family hydrogenase maturation endopeptidase [Methylomagnum sp.]